MRTRRLWIVTLAASAVLAGTGGTATADARYAIAAWGMDESSGTRMLYDSSGHGLHGRIGGEVGRGRGTFTFGRLDPDTPPARPGHLVTLPDNRELDPGGRDYALTIRLRTKNHFGNVIQKGQATVTGGSYKIQMPSGYVQCWFRGSSGQVLVSSPRPANDGRWHTIRCERTYDGVLLSIDGRVVASRAGRTGTISNAWPISIGGKTECNQIDVGCDYFAGEIDYVTVEVDDHAW